MNLSLSSSPGFLVSLDDFYLLGSGLMMTQTTNNVFNSSLFDTVTPNSLLSWQRVRLAHSLAHTGEEWARTFSMYNSGKWLNILSTSGFTRPQLDIQVGHKSKSQRINLSFTVSRRVLNSLFLHSANLGTQIILQTFLPLHLFSSVHHDPPSTLQGTYNNQYMVLDRSKVKLGRSVDDGALTVVEQIPGLVEYSDQTQALRMGNNTSFYLLSIIFVSMGHLRNLSFPLLQVTGHHIMFPSTRRSTLWVVMDKWGRSMERTFPMISVPEPRSSAVTRLMSRTWTLWSASWGLTVCLILSVNMTFIQLVLQISLSYFFPVDFSIFFSHK